MINQKKNIYIKNKTCNTIEKKNFRVIMEVKNLFTSEPYKKTKAIMLENLVTNFVKHLFSNNIHVMLSEWGKYPVTPNAGEVQSLKYLLTTILYEPFRFSVCPLYIELFQKQPLFKLQKDILDAKTLTMIQKMQDLHQYFFKIVRIESTIPKTFSYSSFFFNELFEKNVDRKEIIKKLIYKVLMVALETDNTKKIFYAMLVLTRAVVNSLIISKYQENITKKTLAFDYIVQRIQEETRSQDPQYIEFLINISQVLKDPIYVEEQLTPLKNVYIF